jgi:hypothetical protein
MLARLNEKIATLELRLPSADKYDAQEKKREATEKTEKELAAAEEARAKIQAKWDALVTKYTGLVALDDEEVAKEESYKKCFGLEKTAHRYGQPGCQLYLDHERALVTRKHNQRWLNYAEGLANGTLTRERVQEMEKKRQDEERAKGLHAEHAEDVRLALYLPRSFLSRILV